MKWYNPQNAPFEITGFPFYKTDRVYRRLPLNPSHPLPDAVDGLANETAGGQIRFHGKMKQLTIQVCLGAKPLFFDNYPYYAHMTLACRNSFDLYVSRNGGDFTYSGTQDGIGPEDRYYTKTFMNLGEAEEFDILLNFPLYGTVDKILIGVDDEAEISAPQKKFVDNKKIMIYGGSIQQGACASRPGMCDANILSRWFNREVYNMGFNASGKAEPELAHVMAEIEDVAALVISTEGNCPTCEWLDEKVREFIKIYREKNPETAIVIMPFRVGGTDLLDPDKLKGRLRRREIQQKIVEDFRAAGDKNVHFLLRDDYLPAEFEGNAILHESTVDGIHSTDLGYFWSAKVLYQFLKELI